MPCVRDLPVMNAWDVGSRAVTHATPLGVLVMHHHLSVRDKGTGYRPRGLRVHHKVLKTGVIGVKLCPAYYTKKSRLRRALPGRRTRVIHYLQIGRS